jgi:hypothetical protein
MFIYSISSYSSNYKHWFKENISGEVHSIYQHTINIITGYGICSLQDELMLLSPLSINIGVTHQEFSEFNICVKDKVSFSLFGLMIGEYFFNLKIAKIFNCNILQMQKTLTFLQNQRLVKDILTVIDLSEFGKIIRILYLYETFELKAIGNYAFEIIKLLKESNRKEIWESSIQSLMGYGLGLTPSGDDFICGLLAAQFYIFSDKEEYLNNIIIKTIQIHHSETTLISSAFLEQATRGHFSEAVIDVLKTYADDRQNIQALNLIENIGHTSGTDFLSGLVVGLVKIGGGL